MQGILPENDRELLDHIMDHSWMLFRSQFLAQRHPVLIEASFQHHFASILSSYGQLCCTSRSDQFLVDLEVRRKDREKDKLIDLTCSFPNRNIRCAIELKFKTKRQAAQDHGRIDAYSDIASLERACQDGYAFGQFFMITDCEIYRNPSSGRVGSLFSLAHGHAVSAGAQLSGSISKGRENVSILLNNSHRFQWETIGNWHFLKLRIPSALK